MGIFDKDIGTIQFVPENGVDTTRADNIKLVGNLAVDAYKGKVGADLEKRFKEISNARDQGRMSSERAKAEAANAVATASTKLPGFATDFRKQGAEFFGTFGVGHAAFTKSADELVKEALIKDRAVNMSRVGLDYTSSDDNASYDFMLKAHGERTFYEDLAAKQDAQNKIDQNNISKYAGSAVTEFSTTLMSDLRKDVEANGSLQQPEIYKARIDSYLVELDNRLAAQGVSEATRAQYRAQLRDRFKTVEDFISSTDLQGVMERDGKILTESIRQFGFQMLPFYTVLKNTAGEGMASKFLELSDKYNQAPEAQKKFLQSVFVGNQSIGGEILDSYLTDPSKTEQLIYQGVQRISKGQVQNEGDVNLAVDLLKLSKNQKSTDVQPVVDVVAENTPSELPNSLVQDNLPKWISGTNYQLTESAIALGNELSKFDKGEFNLTQNPDGTFKLEGTSNRTRTLVNLHKGLEARGKTVGKTDRPASGLPAFEIVDLVNDLINKARTNGVEDRLIIEPFKQLVEISSLDTQPEREGIISSTFNALMKGAREAPGDFIKGVNEFQKTAQDIQNNPAEALQPEKNKPSTLYIDESTGMLSTTPIGK